MEVGARDGFLKRFFLSEKIPFAQKRDVNWGAIKWTLLGALIIFMVVVLVTPSTPEPTEQPDVSPFVTDEKKSDPESKVDFPSASRLSNYYVAGPRPQGPSRAGSMIVARGGLDFRNQLPPGSRIRLRLLQGAIVSSESMPIVAVVTEDVSQESGVAIERGAKIFGEASFDDSGDVATVSWTAIQMADGRERAIAALGVSLSGHVGVQGKLHSKRAQNIAGSTISRFIGAYAEGSVKRGVLGYSTGGAENGLKTAVGQTAKDQADSYAGELKKEKRWIELEAGTECLAVLKQAFAFRDPGAYAR